MRAKGDMFKTPSSVSCNTMFYGKKRKYALILAIILGAIITCRWPVAASEFDIKASAGTEKQLFLKSVALSRKSFTPLAKEKVTIHYHPSESCRSSVIIADKYGREVKRLADNKNVAPLPQNIIWLGDDETGASASAGVYYYIIKLKKNSTAYTYNPYQRSHGKKLSVTGWYDAEKKEIHYSLLQASNVRIRVGITDGGPLLATLLDWTPQEAGSHILRWDGRDVSGFIDLSSHSRRNLVIFAYSLADNAIIIKSGESGKKMNKGKTIFDPALPPDSYLHSRHSPDICHEPAILLDFPGSNHNSDKIITVSGKTPVRISIAPEDRKHLENSRYEIMLYTDMVFLFEDEVGYSPFTYQWNTLILPDGEHLLTVNVLSYDDHIGVVTKKVIVKNK